MAIRHVILDNNFFKIKKMLAFSDFIIRAHLHTLSLNYCRVGDEGGVTLGEALLQH